MKNANVTIFAVLFCAGIYGTDSLWPLHAAWHQVVVPGAVPMFPGQERQTHFPAFPQNWPVKDELGFENLALRDTAVPKASSSESPSKFDLTRDL